MDGVRELLDSLRRHGLETGNLRAILHVCIGRRISRSDGTVLSSGITWRELSNLLKQLRWDPNQVTELGLDPAGLPPRDRQRYWYSAISQAGVDAKEARDAAEALIPQIEAIGFHIGPAPGA